MINAIANHGYYKNAHEASSVLREEIEEVSEALAEVEREFTILKETAQRYPCPYCNAMELEPFHKTDLSGHYNVLQCISCKNIVTQLECRLSARRSGELDRMMKERYLKEMNNNA
jgi:DNA repair exonuclease SbcCD ATPase subunit